MKIDVSYTQLRWAFSLYDLNQDGVITKDDLVRIVLSIYELLGKIDPRVEEVAARDHVELIFQVFNHRI